MSPPTMVAPRGPGSRPRHLIAAAIRTALLAAITVLAGCAGSPGIASAERSVSDALLATHGLEAVGPTTTMSMVIGDAAEHPWLLYREVSRAIGLDFASLRGRTAQLEKTPISTAAGAATVFVLVYDGVAVGAWRDAGPMSSGVLPLSE